jgi:hypothetical protein
MLAKRITSTFRAVFSFDPSVLDTLTDKEIREYRQNRQFSDIEEQLRKADSPPTVFHCRPLDVKHEYFADQAGVSGLESDAAWKIFRSHVDRIEHFEPVDRDDDGIKDEHRKDFTRDVVDEIAFLIVEKANLETRGFTLPRTFSEQLIRARLAHRRVSDADTKSASESPTDTSQE